MSRLTPCLPVRLASRRAVWSVGSLVLALTLGACGGSSGDDATSATVAVSTGSPTAAAASVTLQTYITDNLTSDYAKVWVSIQRIVATAADGTEAVLLDASAEPVVVDLASLASVGELVSSATVPVGVWTGVKVTLANAVQLVSLDGLTTTDAKFAASGDTFDWTVRGVTLDTATAAQLVLDFDLEHFSYSATTGLVTPDVKVPTTGTAFGKFVRQQGRVHGTVSAIDASAGTLTITDARLGSVVVTLASDAVITNAATGATMTLAEVTAGATVRVKGTVTPGATTDDPVTVTATLVQVEPASSSSAATTVAVRGAGTVVSLSGTTLTIALTEASFLPSSATLVLDLASARYAHGTAADLVAGATIHFRGKLSGSGSSSSVSASMIDVEGAASATERARRGADSTSATLSTLSGTVGSVATDGTFTATTAASSSARAVAAGTYTVDPSGAVWRAGSASCLVAGASVRASGTLADTTFTARTIEVPGCSGTTSRSAAGRRH
ncbi:protein of unknown function [Sphaerotilus natans]|uniref:DUF4382 domain-containing protein n=1 Tax=Sphaerotilus natans TaxID=34103 RepID=UPI000956FA18|nr:DUF4382 domain-containing protein [Sphaerotilus natans]SIQ20406.1 protein of unknown function [Sphaerotilus natans]